MVFGRCAHHGGAADVDILHGFFDGTIRVGHGGFKGVQVHDHKVDRGNTVFRHDGIIGAAPAQYAAMNLWVQRLYPAIHHFGKAGVV